MRLPCVLFFVLLISTVCAQQPTNKEDNKAKITGKVIDSVSRDGVEDATITVFVPGNSRPVNGATANEKGVFDINDLAPGTYKISIEFIGYKAVNINKIVLANKSSVWNVGEIALIKKADALQSVTVTASKGLVENKIDKMVYNAEKDISSQGGVATDILKKVPMVSVDVDGNVELQGNSNIRFLINGKPSSIFGSNITDALQAIPASQIKSIEVITVPGAKYDAEGTGGIINIILKDSKVRGINGNISLAAGTRQENGSLNLNGRKNNFGVNAFVSANGQLPGTTYTSLNRHSFDTSAKTTTDLLQNGQGKFKRSGIETGIGFVWSPNKRNNITGGFNYESFGFDNTSSTLQAQNTYDQSGNLLSSLNSLINATNHNRSKSYDWNLNYKKTFAKEDQELDFQYEDSYGKNESYFSQYQFDAQKDSLQGGSYSNNPGTDHETNIQLDYTQPFGDKVRLETGAKTVLRKLYSKTDVFAPGIDNSFNLYDSSRSNYLNYDRNIYAAYATIQFPLGKLLDVKAGLRYERTETNAQFSKVNSTVIPGYNTFAPSLAISHSFGDEQMLRLSYGHRVQRPGYRQLNPYVNASDPKNLSTGNPGLKPEIGDHVELAYSKSFEKGSALNIVMFYHRSGQDIQPFVTYFPSYTIGDSTYTNVALTEFQNVGVENNYGMNVYGSVPFTKKLNVRGNLSAYYRHTLNTINPGSNINSFNYRINMNASYQLNGNFVMELFGNFQSPRNEVQGHFPSFYSYTFAFRKLVWKKKGSFGFTTTNPFANFVDQRTSLTGSNFVLNSLRQVPYRSFGLSFTYKFGKLEFKKEKEENNNVPQGDEGG
jgi:ferric enterobactin receptor